MSTAATVLWISVSVLQIKMDSYSTVASACNYGILPDRPRKPRIKSLTLSSLEEVITALEKGWRQSLTEGSSIMTMGLPGPPQCTCTLWEENMNQSPAAVLVTIHTSSNSQSLMDRVQCPITRDHCLAMAQNQESSLRFTISLLPKKKGTLSNSTIDNLAYTNKRRAAL